MYILFDCNNFFASCEQIFRPDWQRRPLVVLSNNDGCIIARSAEAKALGIRMGAPYFQTAELIKRENVVVCSGNFPLYGNISSRVMSILEDEMPEVSQYSIDEAFSFVERGNYPEWEEFARRLRRKIYRWTSITVSVGLAPTHTLAKLANETAKRTPSANGIYSLSDPERSKTLLRQTDIGDIWGVGRKLAPRMRTLGLATAADLASCPPGILRRYFGVHGERLHWELNGRSVLANDGLHSERRQLMCSRSLKEGIEDKARLREILCRFVEQSGRKLRREGLYCNVVGVLLRTSRFLQDDGKTYGNFQTIPLAEATEDTRVITQAASHILDTIWKPGYTYRKLGVILLEREASSLCLAAPFRCPEPSWKPSTACTPTAAPSTSPTAGPAFRGTANTSARNTPHHGANYRKRGETRKRSDHGKMLP